jgi:uncharacterized YccA/Bax inhibitor family protein
MADATTQKDVKRCPKRAELLLVLICALALPLSMIMWIGNLAFSFFTGGASAIHHEGKTVFSLFFLSLWGCILLRYLHILYKHTTQIYTYVIRS